MVTSSEFDYETQDERVLSTALYFVPVVGEYKFLAEIIGGKDLVSGRRYSVGLVRIDSDDVTGLNLRIPSGNETGANSLWLPGGYIHQEMYQKQSQT